MKVRKLALLTNFKRLFLTLPLLLILLLSHNKCFAVGSILNPEHADEYAPPSLASSSDRINAEVSAPHICTRASKCQWRNSASGSRQGRRLTWQTTRPEFAERVLKYYIQNQAAPAYDVNNVAVAATISEEYAIVGTVEGDSAPEKRAEAVLVSDVIPCQQSEGHLTFRYWTSPLVVLKVCTRHFRNAAERQPNVAESSADENAYDWCSMVKIDLGPGPAHVYVRPADKSPFQLYIIAFNFVYAWGGYAMISGLEYNAEFCAMSGTMQRSLGGAVYYADASSSTRFDIPYDASVYDTFAKHSLAPFPVVQQERLLKDEGDGKILENGESNSAIGFEAKSDAETPLFQDASASETKSKIKATRSPLLGETPTARDDDTKAVSYGHEMSAEASPIWPAAEQQVLPDPKRGGNGLATSRGDDPSISGGARIVMSHDAPPYKAASATAAARDDVMEAEESDENLRRENDENIVSNAKESYQTTTMKSITVLGSLRVHNTIARDDNERNDAAIGDTTMSEEQQQLRLRSDSALFRNSKLQSTAATTTIITTTEKTRIFDENLNTDLNDNAKTLSSVTSSISLKFDASDAENRGETNVKETYIMPATNNNDGSVRNGNNVSNANQNSVDAMNHGSIEVNRISIDNNDYGSVGSNRVESDSNLSKNANKMFDKNFEKSQPADSSLSSNSNARMEANSFPKTASASLNTVDTESGDVANSKVKNIANSLRNEAQPTLDNGATVAAISGASGRMSAQNKDLAMTVPNTTVVDAYTQKTPTITYNNKNNNKDNNARTKEDMKEISAPNVVVKNFNEPTETTTLKTTTLNTVYAAQTVNISNQPTIGFRTQAASVSASKPHSAENAGKFKIYDAEKQQKPTILRSDTISQELSNNSPNMIVAPQANGVLSNSSRSPTAANPTVLDKSLKKSSEASTNHLLSSSAPASHVESAIGRINQPSDESDNKRVDFAALQKANKSKATGYGGDGENATLLPSIPLQNKQKDGSDYGSDTKANNMVNTITLNNNNYSVSSSAKANATVLLINNATVETGKLLRDDAIWPTDALTSSNNNTIKFTDNTVENVNNNNTVNKINDKNNENLLYAKNPAANNAIDTVENTIDSVDNMLAAADSTTTSTQASLNNNYDNNKINLPLKVNLTRSAGGNKSAIIFPISARKIDAQESAATKASNSSGDGRGAEDLFEEASTIDSSRPLSTSSGSNKTLSFNKAPQPSKNDAVGRADLNKNFGAAESESQTENDKSATSANKKMNDEAANGTDEADEITETLKPTKYMTEASKNTAGSSSANAAESTAANAAGSASSANTVGSTVENTFGSAVRETPGNYLSKELLAKLKEIFAKQCVDPTTLRLSADGTAKFAVVNSMFVYANDHTLPPPRHIIANIAARFRHDGDDNDGSEIKSASGSNASSHFPAVLAAHDDATLSIRGANTLTETLTRRETPNGAEIFDASFY